jgi:hypothetical protein
MNEKSETSEQVFGRYVFRISSIVGYARDFTGAGTRSRTRTWTRWG